MEEQPHVDFDTRPMDDLEREACIRMLYQRDLTKRERSQLERLKEERPPLQNPSNLAVFEDDAMRRELFLVDVGKRIVAQGTGPTTAYLRRDFGFTRKQIKVVIDEARRELSANLMGETELLRAVAAARIESLMARARNACDITNEIRAFKEWARLLGLYQTEETGMGDLAALMRELSKTQGPDPEKIVDAEFTDVDAGEETWSIPNFEAFEELDADLPPPTKRTVGRPRKADDD